MSRVLVTGGTGFVASNTIKLLLEKGYKVRATARDANDKKAQFLKDWGVEVVTGDLNKSEGWSDAVEGCDYVLHMASPFFIQYKNEEEDLLKPAVNGVKNVFAGMKGKEIRKVVITSSVASVMAGHELEYTKKNVLDESVWSDTKKARGYELSKTRAEQTAWELAKEYGLKMDAINPGLVMGPLYAEHHVKCESSSIILQVTSNLMQVPVVIPAVDARDVAKAHVLAMERDSDGDRFICCADNGTNTTLLDIAQSINEKGSRVTKAKASTTMLPAMLLSFAGLFSSTAASAKAYIQPVTLTNEKAKTVLGIKFAPYEDGLLEHMKSLVEYGKLPKPN